MSRAEYAALCLRRASECLGYEIGGLSMIFPDGTSAKDHHARLAPRHPSQVEPISWPKQEVCYTLVSQLVDWIQLITYSLLKGM